MTFNEEVVHLTHMFMMMTINCDPNYQILLVETFSKKNQPIYSQSVQIRTIFFTSSSIGFWDSVYLDCNSSSRWFFIYLSFKAMKESYRQEQKRRIKELASALKDPSVIILSSWLKVRIICSSYFSATLM